MKKKILVVLFVVFLSLFKINSVYASENDSILNREFIPNVWSFHYRNGKVWTYGQLNIKHINGKIGYCIEPESAVNSNVYNSSTDWSISKYSEYVKKRMELYAYYGYQFEGHQTIRYYMATQELIWSFSDDEKIIWTTEDHSDSQKINVQAEKNEIVRLANKHNLIPSFSNLSYKYNVGDKVNLEDTNYALNGYAIKTDINYSVRDYILSFTVPKRNRVDMLLVPKGRSYDQTIVYSCNFRSQRIATFGVPDNPKSNLSLTIIPDKIKVKVNKKDSETKNLITDAGNIIKIKNLDKNEYVKLNNSEEIPVGTDGTVSIYLEDGNYEIEEVHASNGYSINKEKVTFKVDKNLELDNDTYNVDFYNNKVYGKIKIKKVNELNENLEGCKFEIYDKDMKLVDTLVTTKNEYDESVKLELGEYYVKEVETLNGYILDNKVYKVNLDYENDEKEIVFKTLNLTNKKIRCDLLVVTSHEDNKPLSGVTVNIYDSSKKIVYTKTTDENGEIKIDDITYGDYYLKQVSVPNGYELNDETISFKVNDDNCLSKISMKNNKVNMPKTTTKNIDIISLIILFINVGIIKFVKKVN